VEQIAIVGTGLIGRSWSVVFARAGHVVSLWDRDPDAARAALEQVANMLAELEQAKLIDEAAADVMRRVRISPSLEQAIGGAAYVQESTSELVEVKQQVFAQMDAVAPADCILASSTSTIPASRFSREVHGRHRCVVAHPVNPPHLIPVVEVSPAPWTDSGVVNRTLALQAHAGQVPVLLKKEVPGFLVNRLQAALLLEAWRLIKEGCCTVEDLDKCIRDGLGLRWSFMGPFETIDLNAPGGIADYARRYGPPMYAALKDTRYEPWDEALIAAVDAERRALLPPDRHQERQTWRDRRLMALAAHVRGMRDSEPL
jgi:3-hydroxyacyl-CoA dehydrogenase